MYDAQNQGTGLIDSAADANKEHAHSCPVPFCRTSVELRAGPKRRPHFAHLTASPWCPRYHAQTTNWSGGDTSSALCFVELGGGVATIIPTDPVQRFRFRVPLETLVSRRTPLLENQRLHATNYRKMVFSRAMHGTRLRSGQPLFLGEEYIVVLRDGDTVPLFSTPMPGLLLPRWHARKISVPRENTRSVREFARELDLIVAGPREVDEGTPSTGASHYLLLATTGGACGISISAAAATVDRTRSDVRIRAHRGSEVVVNVASAAAAPVPSRTMFAREGGRQVLQLVVADTVLVGPSGPDSSLTIRIEQEGS